MSLAKPAPKGFKLRQMMESDLKAVDDLLEEAHFDIGSNNFKLNFETSPQGFLVIEDEAGNIAAMEGCNLMSNGLKYSASIIVSTKYRGKGLIKMFSGPGDMGSATPDSIRQLVKKAQALHHKRVGFYGAPQVNRIESWLSLDDQYQCVDVTSSNIEQLLDYDQDIMSGVDRRKYISNWCNSRYADTKSITLMIVNKTAGKVCGYGVLRQHPGFVYLSPLYADSDVCAQILAATLMKKFEETFGIAYFYLDAAADKHVNFQLAHLTGLDFVSTETFWHNHNPRAIDFIKSIPFDKIYATIDFWPV